ncbi:MAG: nuclear transport factor 2 family protein [Pseudoclavibacter sp.]
MAAHRLGARVARLEAIRAIRACQSRFSRLLASGDAAGAAACFLPDATIEIGASGVFAGRRRIHVSLTRLACPSGSSSRSATPGLSMHAHVMPIIVVDSTLNHATATWRGLDTGATDNGAYWADGVVVSRYRRTSDGWMLASLRWERTLHVPFDGGWHDNADAGPTLGIAPDRPATGHVPIWPDIPDEPLVLDPRPAPLPDEAPGHADVETSSPGSDDDLLARVASAERTFEIAYVISRLGYAFDDADWRGFTDQLSEDAIVQIGAATIRGRDALLAALRAICGDRETQGRLLETVLFEPEIALGDGSARATVRFLSQWAVYGRWHELGIGTCVVEFDLVETGWQVTRLDASETQFTSYDRGWADERSAESRLTRADHPAPLTGFPDATLEDGARTAAAWPISAPDDHGDATRVLSLDERVSRLESLVEIEQTQYAYGYHLSSLAWSQLTELFAEDGTIEIALRGVYRGRPSIRRSLDLFGAGPEHGVLHSHLQFQPIVELSTDGQRATVRARSFSMLGKYRSMGMWTAGRYRNEYVRPGRTAQWRIAIDRLVNRYFAPYEVGWKDIPHRDPPGMSETKPPDSPPTERFSLYPH